MGDFLSTPLTREHAPLLKDFKCEDSEFERYISEIALTEHYSGKGVTYLVFYKQELIAYYTLSTAQLLWKEYKTVPPKGDKKEFLMGISAIEIKMFAVSSSYQRKIFTEDTEEGKTYYSDIVLSKIISDAEDMAIDIVGFECIVLRSVPSAINFYERNGFYTFPSSEELTHDSYSEGCTPMLLYLY